MFVGLDGLCARVLGGIKSADKILLLDARALPYLAGLNDGDHTYLILDDGVNFEVVKYVGTKTVTQTADGVRIMVERGLNGNSFNFSSSTIIKYGFCTQVIRDILADAGK